MKHLLSILLAAVLLSMPGSARSLQHALQIVPTAKKVTIDDGQVYLNGKRVDDSRLPEGLRTLDPDVSLTFWTGENALFEINGQSFVFEDDRFRIASPNETTRRNVVMVFSGQEDGANIRLFEAPQVATGYYVTSAGDKEATMNSYVSQLRERAEEFNKLTFELKEVVPESNELARQMVVEAENAARIASFLPRVEYEAYLGSLQSQNRQLYDELQRERSMEMRTHELARAARQAATTQERESHMKELRGVLTEIFELKQANRRKEIEQLERQLKELQGRLAERESLKKDIIESRLDDLLELHRW
jgi:predicted ester cyclase